MITVIEKSSSKPSPAVKPLLDKNEGYQSIKNDFNYISVIGSLNFLTNSTRPEAKFAVHQCAQFRFDTKLPHHRWELPVLRYQNILKIFSHPFLVSIAQLFSWIIFINDYICILTSSPG